MILLLMIGLLTCVSTVPSNISSNVNLQEEVNSLKYTTKLLTAQLEKWNNLFLTSLEPRLALTASSLSSINSNINNLQERAHVWDTFQLHVSAWNDQLATLDRKADIISKGQEKIVVVESKINSVINLEYKIDEILVKLSNVHDSLNLLKEEFAKQDEHKSHDVLFGEFAARGILSSIKMVEKKLDKLLLTQHTSVIRLKSGEKSQMNVKCNTPHFVEDLLRDISSKVDILFDRSNGKEEIEYDIQEDGSGGAEMPLELKALSKNNTESVNQNLIETILEQNQRIGNMTEIISDTIDINRENLETLLFQCNTNSSVLLEAIFNKIEESGEDFNKKFNAIMESYFSEQRAHFESFLLKHIRSLKNHIETSPNSKVDGEEKTFFEPTKTGCEDLEPTQKSGVYVFGNNSEFNSKNRSYNQRYCLIRNDGSWTVIQNRDNYPSPQNFNLTWFDYKNGFGNLHKDFWFGNDFISQFSTEKKLVLRIELEDFNGNKVWAEYSKFVVLPEKRSYKMMVGEYKGNASDSFSGHNNSLFSTFDRKNDEAPECCPCAVSYGGGWWFNSCFESNLNGVYYKNPVNNGYFKGIIWEYWLGNYSLKKTVMMVKSSNNTQNSQGSTWAYYEDP